MLNLCSRGILFDWGFWFECISFFSPDLSKETGVPGLFGVFGFGFVLLGFLF